MNSTCELGRHSARALKPYPDYTNSGVEWLGKVPAHWEVLKLRHVLRRHTERERPDLPLLSVVREQGVILRDTTSTDENHNYIPDDLSNYKVVRAGQFAMNKMKAWQGSYGVSCHDGIVSPAYFVFDVLGLEVDFFHTAIRSRAYVPVFTRASDGVRIGQWDLAEARMREIQFLVPPAAEQAAIVRFLDHADRRIRRYIRAQQQLVMLLEEQKQAIIHQAITGQIDVRTGRPFPGYKPSGVPWLGDVPEHWEIAQLGRLIDLLTGFPFKSEGFTQDADDIRLLRGANIAPGKVRWNDIVRWPIRDRPSYLSFELHAGDIVLGMDRPIIQSGVRVATIEESDLPSLLLQRVACIRPEGRLRADFLILLLAGKSFSAYLAPIFTGISVPHLSPEQIRLFRFALPAVMEQEKIVEWTVASTKTVESAVKRTHREIALLGEYRTRLIADVVTGKLDVRAAAARLQDEVEELEPLDEADAVIDGEDEPNDALATAP